MKIIVTTFYNSDYKPLAEKTVNKNLKFYCDKHGYKLIIYELPGSFEGNGYQKLCQAGKVNAQLVIKTLNENANSCDYIFTVGSDVVITNTALNLEDLIDFYYKEYDIVTGQDKFGISTSQMLIKNSYNSLNYFGEILKYISDGGEHDQRYFWDNQRDFIAKAPHRLLNSYDCEKRLEPSDDLNAWKPGDFLVHMAGLTMEQRMNRLDYWLSKVK